MPQVCIRSNVCHLFPPMLEVLFSFPTQLALFLSRFPSPYTDGPEDGMPLLKILRKIFHVLTASDPPRWNAKHYIDGMFCCRFGMFQKLQMECFHMQMECFPLQMECLQICRWNASIWGGPTRSKREKKMFLRIFKSGIPSSGPSVRFSTSTFHFFWWLCMHIFHMSGR